MKEMDPSEEILMERAMMEDEDLLIEVESMRQTLQKLDKLPKVSPPKEVRESIMQKASEHARERRKANKSFKPVYKYAVAATLALTITAGGTWFFINRNGQQASKQPVTVQSRSMADTQAGKLELTANGVRQSGVETAGEYKVEPWVDRNEVLRFEDQFIPGDNQFDAILRNTTKKLQLIDQPVMNNHRVKPIQLTGSGN
jgi:hypothetical protein